MSTRTSRTWVKVLPGLVILAVLLVFVFQNLRSTKVSFFTVSGSLPLALALLGAAALGALSLLALGSVRILQLRKTIRTHRRQH
ncbi:MAG: lipopolysaccharide assembly protein LapA domain-containing protein [Acidimicrobiales bacterium]